MIKVMTDNAANLPPELRAQYGITELCLTYTIDGEPVDISKPFDGHAFYEAMRKGAEVKTSMITPLAAREAMEPVLDRGDDVLYVGLSGGVSGTCWGVSVVAQELRERYPDRDIRVLDSRGASLGEGLIVLAGRATSYWTPEVRYGAEGRRYGDDRGPRQPAYRQDAPALHGGRSEIPSQGRPAVRRRGLCRHTAADQAHPTG